MPPNVRFEVDDFENDWVYASKFDFIHGRYLAGAVKDWPRLMGQAFKYEKLKRRLTHGEDRLIWNRFTKPGGWVEFQDFDMQFYTANGEFTPDCPLAEWTRIVINGLKKAGVEPEPGPKLEGWVKEAGFTNIHHKLLPIPVGVWPKNRKLVSSPKPIFFFTLLFAKKFLSVQKEIGALDYHQFLEGLEGISMHIFTASEGWKPEEVQLFLVGVRQDLKNPRLQAQHNL